MGSWPPREVDMLTFSQLTRADPLEDDQVVGGNENFRSNGLDGAHLRCVRWNPTGRRPG